MLRHCKGGGGAWKVPVLPAVVRRARVQVVVLALCVRVGSRSDAPNASAVPASGQMPRHIFQSNSLSTPRTSHEHAEETQTTGCWPATHRSLPT